MSMRDKFIAHMKTGLTTVCHAWAVIRNDGVIHGFTDHDGDFEFEGFTFQSSFGMTAHAFDRRLGLAPDNSEALGILSDESLKEEDIACGRYDGAEVRMWLVNWQDVSQRLERFRGNFGDITRTDGAFRVELRGLSEKLNVAKGRVYSRTCDATLGNVRCGVDLQDTKYKLSTQFDGFDENGNLLVTDAGSYPENWFKNGTIKFLSGKAEGLSMIVSTDAVTSGQRVLSLWDIFRTTLQEGDLLELTAGCEKSFNTCRVKFSNALNFQGFPHLPSDDHILIKQRLLA